MKQCKFCGEQIPDDATVCPICCEEQATEEKVCPYCAETIEADATCCPVCGEDLTDAPSTTTDPSVASPNAAATPYRAEPSSSSMQGWLIACVVLLVIAVGAACFLGGRYLMGDKKDASSLATDSDSTARAGVISADVLDDASDADSEYDADAEQPDYGDEPTDDVPLCSSIPDWSMIRPIRFGSDAAYDQYRQNNGGERSIAEGGLGEGEVRMDFVNIDDTHIAGRYHNLTIDVSLDLNGTWIDDVLYLQLGHGSSTSHAVLRSEPSFGNTHLVGTWGKSNKPVDLEYR